MAANEEIEKFEGHYDAWRTSRIRKIESLYGKEFFRGKSLLELGCGLGHVGLYFRSLGADVTFADGRSEYIEDIKSRYPEVSTLVLDQDKNWFILKRFDIVIHWGVLYHLNNWQRDLRCALAHAPLLFLETEVCDSDDPTFEIKVDEPAEGYDQALHRTGSRPSAPMIEEHLAALSAAFIRFDDSRINADIHRYDWQIKNTKTWEHGLRRFWLVKRG